MSPTSVSTMRSRANARVPAASRRRLPSANRSLASETGGEVFYADTRNDLSSAFQRVIQQMRIAYLVTYSPEVCPMAGGTRST
jgi:hypothetical protein